MKERNLNVIDVICFLVIKVYFEVVCYVKEGYIILLIGYEGYDEVIGMMGEVFDFMLFVEFEEDVECFDFFLDVKVVYLI